MSSFEITYHIQAAKILKTFSIPLSLPTISLAPQNSTPPEWTRLQNCQCDPCPLSLKDHSHCPAALSLVDVVDLFKDFVSFEKVKVEVVTRERTYFKEVPLQKAVSSLMGILMTTSGCPILGKLKPMVRFHLPFANVDETVFRMIGMYLVAQYLRKQKGLSPDWDLKNLTGLYQEIQKVNRHFCDRLGTIKTEDALPNAVIILNSYADSLIFSLSQEEIERLTPLFDLYFHEE